MSRYLYKKIQNISPESLNFQHSGLKLTTLGFDADAYVSLLDYELETDMENKYPVHATSYTMSGKDNESGDKGGRTPVDNPTNENTIQSKSSGSNSNPKPSTE